MPLFEPSVARVTARFRSVVTCDRAPSAVCNMPIALLAFCCDCVSAAMFAPIPFAIDKPAASSEPELIFKPVDNWVRVFCRLDCVLDSAFSADREEMLLRIESAMGVSPCCALLRLHSARLCGPALRLRLVEKEDVLDSYSIG